MRTPAEILKFHFDRKKETKPGFSLRVASKSMAISPSFFSAVMNGKKSLPNARVAEICKALDLDGAAAAELIDAVAREQIGSLGLDQPAASEIKNESLRSFVQLANSKFSLLNPWYNIAILDLSTCDHFQKEPLWIAAQLGLSRYQVTESLRKLVEHGLLIETPSGFEKVDKKIRLALNSSHAEIRKFHLEMIKKAQSELLEKTTKQDFDLREISGITIAANPKNIARARQIILAAVHEAADVLAEGECTDLFQINTQLFSLLKRPSESGS